MLGGIASSTTAPSDGKTIVETDGTRRTAGRDHVAAADDDVGRCDEFPANEVLAAPGDDYHGK